MIGRSHLFITGASYLALLLHPVSTPLGLIEAPRLQSTQLDLGIAAIAVSALVAAASGVLPDLDRAGSAAARAGGPITRVIATTMQHTLGHRGALHSGLAVAVVWLLGSWLGTSAGLPGLGEVIAYGWAAHVLLDAWTAHGVPILWPVPGTFRLPPGFATGSLAERIVLWVSLAACGGWAALAVLASVGVLPLYWRDVFQELASFSPTVQ